MLKQFFQKCILVLLTLGYFSTPSHARDVYFEGSAQLEKRGTRDIYEDEMNALRIEAEKSAIKKCIDSGASHCTEFKIRTSCQTDSGEKRITDFMQFFVVTAEQMPYTWFYTTACNAMAIGHNAERKDVLPHNEEGSSSEPSRGSGAW